MNARSAQLLAAALGFLLIVLIGAVIFILLSRPAQGPVVSPTPTSAAVVSPGLSPTLSPLPSGSPILTFSLPPTFSPEPSPSPSPVITPEITPTLEPTPTPTPSPTPTASPTPSPTPTPTLPPVTTSPARQVRVDNLGLDGRNPEVGVERYVLFHADGPSLIRATLSNATGQSRVCLWQGNDVEGGECGPMRNGTIEIRTDAAGQTSWTLSLIGREQALGPVVDVTLDFNANSPEVTFENLRFQGQASPTRNGIIVSVDAAAAGNLTVTGAFDAGQQHMYQVVIDPGGTDQTAGPAPNFSVTQPVAAATPYTVSVSNPNPGAEPGPVFIEVTLTWP